jgi:NADH dehydrogenase
VLPAEVVEVDTAGRWVALDDGTRVGYDWLVLATGATHSYFGRDDWAELAPGLKTLEDALTIRRKVLSAFERAERYPDRAGTCLTFVVVGGGPTGVELAGALKEIAVHALTREFRSIDPGAARVILVEGTDHVLPIYPTRLSESARRQLEGLGVEVRTGALVEDISPDGVKLTDGSTIGADTVLWAAGVRASPLAAMVTDRLDRAGRALVEPDLSIPGHPEVFVVGDLAGLDGVPGVAPAAIQAGRHAAAQIGADLSGRPRRPFRYRDKGSLATIGRARGVADIGPLEFGGSAAWAAWLGIHLFFLIGFRNRLLVMISWAWNYVTFRRGARIITDVGVRR